MTFTKEGKIVNVYDIVTADTIEVGDQILVNNIDPIEVEAVIDSGEAIMIKGYSHLSGDKAEYILSADAEIGLWGV